MSTLQNARFGRECTLDAGDSEPREVLGEKLSVMRDLKRVMPF